ncbi:MAG: type IV secretion system protein VirB3 [Hyphomicrobium sp.]
MTGKEPLHSDTLFLACTRPAMFAGVTVEAMGINVFVTTLLFLGLGSIAYALIGIVLHRLSRIIVRHDHNAFRVLAGWADTKGRYRNSAYWGGSSATPLRLKRTYDFGDLAHG